MAAPKQITDAELEVALRKANGVQSLAAQELGVGRQDVHARIRGSKAAHWNAVLADIDERILDMAEIGAMKLLAPGGKAKPDGPTVRWYLEMKGGGRGWKRPTSSVKFDDDDIATLVVGLGGDLEKLRAVRAALEAAAPGEPDPI